MLIFMYSQVPTRVFLLKTPHCSFWLNDSWRMLARVQCCFRENGLEGVKREQIPCKAAWHLTPSVGSMSKARIKCLLLLNSTGWHSALLQVLCQQHTMAGKAGCSMLTVHQTQGWKKSAEHSLTFFEALLCSFTQNSSIIRINIKLSTKQIQQAHSILKFSFWMATNKF